MNHWLQSEHQILLCSYKDATPVSSAIVSIVREERSSDRQENAGLLLYVIRINGFLKLLHGAEQPLHFGTLGSIGG
jgi:hypothetical protein